MKPTDFLNEPLYSSRIVNNYIKLIKSQYNYIDVKELLNYAGMEPYQVEDEGHWFSQNQINKFHHRLRELTGNRDIAREAGRFAAIPGTLGHMRHHLLGLVGPEYAYNLIGNYASKFTKSSEFKSHRLSPNKVEIVVTPKSGVQEGAYQCENRFGLWEAVATAFNYDLPTIDHPECVFKGGKSCRYIISWQESPAIFWRKFRNLIGIALFGAFLISFGFVPSWHISVASLAFSVSIFLGINLYVIYIENKQLLKAVANLQESSNNSIDLINTNYEHALLINEVSQALSKELELNNILANVVNILEMRLDYDRGLILLANKEKTRLIAKNGFGYNKSQLNEFMLGSTFRLDREDSKGVFVVSFHEKKPLLVNDIDEIKDTLTTKSLEFAQKIRAKSFICCPIVYEQESIGILAVDNIKTKKPLLQSDINILMGIANQIGISINNAKMVEARFRQFQSILQVLAATTDARDPITAGHSTKVTEYTVGICNEMGLSYNFTEMIRVASLLHDYGKIGVDDAILRKPGRLTPEEYEHIKTHAPKTRIILEQVNFEGIYTEVPEIAGAHHEKLDGTGYPNGLKEDQIHFGAKIIAVADVFEALTSKRHYREPMPLNDAFDYLVENIGIHFDKKCVGALINFYNSNSTDKPYVPKADLDFKI
jgi:HD-GYP domain-containing protein (c-di-GMP phosphodiesterase class II)